MDAQGSAQSLAAALRHTDESVLTRVSRTAGGAAMAVLAFLGSRAGTSAPLGLLLLDKLLSIVQFALAFPLAAGPWAASAGGYFASVSMVVNLSTLQPSILTDLVPGQAAYFASIAVLLASIALASVVGLSALLRFRSEVVETSFTFLAAGVTGVGFVPLMGGLLSVLDCGEGTPALGLLDKKGSYKWRGSSWGCGSPPHVTAIAFGIVFAAALLLLGTLYVLLVVDRRMVLSAAAQSMQRQRGEGAAASAAGGALQPGAGGAVSGARAGAYLAAAGGGVAAFEGSDKRGTGATWSAWSGLDVAAGRGGAGDKGAGPGSEEVAGGFAFGDASTAGARAGTSASASSASSSLTGAFVGFLQRAGAALSSASLGSFHAVPWPTSSSSMSLTATATGRVLALELWCRFLLALFFVFKHRLPTVVLALLCAAVALVLYLAHAGTMPYNYMIINSVYCGACVACLWASLMAVLSEALPAASFAGTIFLFGLPLTFFGGLSLFARRRRQYILNALELATSPVTTLPSSGAAVLDAHARIALFYSSWAGTSALMQSITPALLSVARAGLGMASGSVGLRRSGAGEGGLGEDEGSGSGSGRGGKSASLGLGGLGGGGSGGGGGGGLTPAGTRLGGTAAARANAMASVIALSTERVIDPQSAAEAVFTRALQDLPPSPLLHFNYAMFLLHGRGNRLLALAHLDRADALGAPLDLRYAIRQIWSAQETIPPHPVDRTVFQRITFEQQHAIAQQLTYVARVRLAEVWRLVGEKEPDPQELVDAARRFDMAARRTQEAFQELLDIQPDNVSALRDFADFLVTVVNDEPRAAELLEKAEKAEDLLSRRQHRGHGHPLLYLSPTDPLELTTDAAAFTLSMEGNINSVNSTALRIFRTARREMIGKPFASLLPPLLDVMFMSRLVNVLQAGDAAQPLGPRAGFFQRSDGTMFPVKAHVGYIGRRLAALIEPVVASESFFVVTPPPRITEALRSMSVSGNVAALSSAAASSGSGWVMSSCDAPTLTLLGIAQDDVASSSVFVERYMPAIGRLALEALAKFFGVRPHQTQAPGGGGNASGSGSADGNSGPGGPLGGGGGAGASLRRPRVPAGPGAPAAVDSSGSTPRVPVVAATSSFHSAAANPFTATGGAGNGGAGAGGSSAAPRHAASIINGGASVRGGGDGTVISEDASYAHGFLNGASRSGGSNGALSRTHIVEVVNIEVDRVVDGLEEAGAGGGGMARAGSYRGFGPLDPAQRTFVALRLYFYADPDTPHIPGVWFASWRRTSPPAHVLAGRGGASHGATGARFSSSVVAGAQSNARRHSNAASGKLEPAMEADDACSDNADSYSVTAGGPQLSDAEPSKAVGTPAKPAATAPPVIMELVPPPATAPETPPAASPAAVLATTPARPLTVPPFLPPTATGSDNDDLVALLMDVNSDEAEDGAAEEADGQQPAASRKPDAAAPLTPAPLTSPGPRPPAGPPPGKGRRGSGESQQPAATPAEGPKKLLRASSPHPRRGSNASLPDRQASPAAAGSLTPGLASPSLAAATPRTPAAALPQPPRNRSTRRLSSDGGPPVPPLAPPTPAAGGEPLASPAAAPGSSRAKALPARGDWREEHGNEASGNAGGRPSAPRSEASSQTSRMTATDMLRRQIDMRRKMLDPALASLQRVFFLIFVAVVGCNIAALIATFALTDGARLSLDKLQASAQRELLLHSSASAAHALALLASGATNAEWLGSPFSTAAARSTERMYSAALARGVNASSSLPPLETSAAAFGSAQAWTYLGLQAPLVSVTTSGSASATALVAPSLAEAVPVPLAPLLNDTAGLRLTAALNATATQLTSMVAALDDLQQALYSAAQGSQDNYDTTSVRVIGRPGQVEDKIRVVTVVDAVSEVIAASRAIVNRALSSPYAATVPAAPLTSPSASFLADPALVYLLKNAPTTISAAANATTSTESVSAGDSLEQTRVIQPFITLSLALLADVLLIAVLVPLARRMQSAVQVVLETLLLVPTRVTRSLQVKAQLSAERVLAAVIQESDLLMDGSGVGAGFDLAGDVMVDMDGQLAVVQEEGEEGAGGEEGGEEEPFIPGATGAGATAGGRGTRGPFWAGTTKSVAGATVGGATIASGAATGRLQPGARSEQGNLGGVYGSTPSSNSLSLSVRPANKDSNKPRHLRETSRAYCTMLLGFSTPLWMVLMYLLMSYLVISSLLSLSLKAPRQTELAYRRAALTQQFDQLVRTASQLPADPSPEAALVLNVTLTAIDAISLELDTVNQLILFGDESVLLPSAMKTLSDQNTLFLSEGCAAYATTPTTVAGSLLSVNEPLAAAGILPESLMVEKHSAACTAFDKGVFAYGMRGGLEAFVQAGRDLVAAALSGRPAGNFYNATAANASTCAVFPRPLLVALYTYADSVTTSSMKAVQSYGVGSAADGGMADGMNMGSAASGSLVVGYQSDPFAGLGGRRLAGTTGSAALPACLVATPAGSAAAVPSLNDWLAPLAAARQHLATLSSTFITHAMVFSAGSFAVSASAAVDLVRAFYLAATILSSVIFLVFWLGIYRSAMTRHNRLLYQVRSLLLLVPNEVTKANPAIASAQLRIATQVQTGNWLSIADAAVASDSDGDSGVPELDKRSKYIATSHASLQLGMSTRSSNRRAAAGSSSEASPRGPPSRRAGTTTPSSILRKPVSQPPLSFTLTSGGGSGAEAGPKRAPSPVPNPPDA